MDIAQKNAQNLKESVDSNLYDVEKMPREDFVKYPKSKMNMVNLLLNSLPKSIEKSGYARRLVIMLLVVYIYLILKHYQNYLRICLIIYRHIISNLKIVLLILITSIIN